MNESAALLPFFFRENKFSNTMFLSNQLGAFTHLKDRKQLTALIDNDLSYFSDKKINELYSKSFLCEENDKVTKGNILASNIASRINNAISDLSLFIVVPTLRCDHDCKYCQVSRAPLNKKGCDLSVNNISDIISVISTSKSESIKIEFQGGEPLVAFDFIKEFVSEAEIKLTNKLLAFVICSALGPLSDEMVEWSKHHNIVFSVSLDGAEDVHNTNRPSKYFNPFKNTIQKVKYLQNDLGEHRVSCLSTTSKYSLNFSKEIVDTYYQLGLSGLFIRPISPFGFASKSQMKQYYSVDEYFEFYKKSLEYVINLNSHRMFVEETTAIHLRKIFSSLTCSYVDLQTPAGYLFSALVFNFDGNIFGSDEARMLWQMTKSDELILGNLNTLNDGKFNVPNSTKTLLSGTFIECTPGCEECAYQPYCGSDPLHHLATQGDHVGNKAFSFFCKLQRKIYDHIFDLLENDLNAKNVMMSWLKH